MEEHIWEAVAKGSWVSPQLIAGLRIKGFDFMKRAPK
jgi:hypothetical protein